MPTLVAIHLAINDPRDGSPTGKASGLEIIAHDDIAFSLEPVTGDSGPVCRIFQRTLRLGRRTYPIRFHSTWVGSWCWDTVRVDLDIGAAILNHARSSRWWSPDSGWSAMWERWESGEPFTASFLSDQLRPIAIATGPLEPEPVGVARHRVFTEAVTTFR